MKARINPKPNTTQRKALREECVKVFDEMLEYYNKESELKGTAEVIIAKQRNGPIGTVTLAWLPQFTKFANIKK